MVAAKFRAYQTPLQKNIPQQNYVNEISMKLNNQDSLNHFFNYHFIYLFFNLCKNVSDSHNPMFYACLSR